MENKEQTLLEKVAMYAIEQYPDDLEKAAEFVDGFIEKAAAFHGGMPGMVMGGMGGARGGRAGFMADLGREITGGFGKSLGGLAVTLATVGAGAATNHFLNQSLHTKFLEALEQAIAGNRNLREASHEKVMSYAETIFKFAPHVATDANLLTHLLNNSIQGDGVDINTIKMLGDMEQRYQGNTGFSSRNL